MTQNMMKRYKIAVSEYGYELYYYGSYEGCSSKLWLIRKWARDCWQEARANQGPSDVFCAAAQELGVELIDFRPSTNEVEPIDLRGLPEHGFGSK